MKVKIEATTENVIYTVMERGTVSDKTLMEMYYTLKDGYYSKTFSTERLMFPHDLVLLEKNYNAYLKDEFLPRKRTWHDLDAALLWLAAECKGHNIRWWLTGSGALYIRGLAVKPHDLDVMTYKTEINAIRKVVAPFIVESFHYVTDWVAKGFGVIDYRYRIDFAFEPEEWVDGNGPVDFGPYAQAHLEMVSWHGMEIFVPPVELHIAPNERRGRHKRVALIREYMASKQ